MVLALGAFAGVDIQQTFKNGILVMVGDLPFKWDCPNGGVWKFPSIKNSDLTTSDGLQCSTEMNANVPFQYL